MGTWLIPQPTQLLFLFHYSIWTTFCGDFFFYVVLLFLFNYFYFNFFFSFFLLSLQISESFGSRQPSQHKCNDHFPFFPKHPTKSIRCYDQIGSQSRNFSSRLLITLLGYLGKLLSCSVLVKQQYTLIPNTNWLLLDQLVYLVDWENRLLGGGYPTVLYLGKSFGHSVSWYITCHHSG